MDELISLVRQRRIFQNVVRIEWLVSEFARILVSKELCELLLNMIKVVYPQVKIVIRGKTTYLCCIICYFRTQIVNSVFYVASPSTRRANNLFLRRKSSGSKMTD
jgi:hypothetical protein